MTTHQHAATAPRSPWPSDLSAFCFEVPHSAEALLFESGKGVRLTDATGRSYLDALSGVFVTCFGYDCEPIVQAVTDQLRTLPFNPPARHQPGRPRPRPRPRRPGTARHHRAKLVNGGSESIEAAVRLARLHHRAHGNPGKVKILSYYHGYHGATFGSLSSPDGPTSPASGPGCPASCTSGRRTAWRPSGTCPGRAVGRPRRRHDRADHRSGGPRLRRRPRHGTRHPPARHGHPLRRLPRPGTGGLRPARRPAGLRRDRHRLRPHRPSPSPRRPSACPRTSCASARASPAATPRWPPS